MHDPLEPAERDPAHGDQRPVDGAGGAAAAKVRRLDGADTWTYFDDS
jgi:hypothetical protein